MLDYPKLRRGLQAFPVDRDGHRFVALCDGMGYAHDSLLIPLQLARLLDHMNGDNSLRDLQAFYLKTTGELLFTEYLRDLVEKLDENLFLESDRFLEILARERGAFEQDPVRRMQFAGKSYPLDPGSLRSRLNDFFSEVQKSLDERRANGRNLVALVAPHIDISAGGVCFAHAYRAMLDARSPSTWVILGIGHEPVENYFALTEKDFETPLGVIECDRHYSGKLRQRARRNLLAGEYLHRKEHTVEFQTVFLAYTRPSSRIVPLLCSFSLEEWQADRMFIDETAGLLRQLALDARGALGFIASVDLAHIGPRYGDRFIPHAGTVEEHLAADRALLKSLGKADPEEFMVRAARGLNHRRVCGMSSLYILARILDGWAEGEVLDHAYAVVDHQSSFVTFASMAFYAKEA